MGSFTRLFGGQAPFRMTKNAESHEIFRTKVLRMTMKK